MKLPKIKFKFIKKRIIIFSIILVAVLAGFFFFGSRSKKEVATAIVQRGTVKEELILTGTVKAEKHAILSFPTSGKIVWVGVTEGQKVAKGQGLISLDKTVLNTIYQQSLNSYRNYQAAAESALDSVKDHAGDETFTQKATRTAAEVARDNAYDAMLAAKYNLDNATLLSPFAGIVSSLAFENPGINVSLADTIVEVIDPSSIYFEVDADQSEVTNIKQKQEVTIILDSFKDKEFKGVVSFVGLTPKSGETGAIYKVKVKFSDSKALDDSLKVGMTGDGRFILSQKENALYVPVKFVNSDKTGKFVNIGRPGGRVSVETGIEGEEVIEITKGVKEGDILYD